LVTEEGVREWLAALDSAVGENQTRDLSITSPTFYHWDIQLCDLQQRIYTLQHSYNKSCFES